jgi:hypothetical protein
MQLSLADLNKKIAKLVHADIELVRGEGYHYLVFDDGKRYESKSIMVPYLSQMTNDQWLQEAVAFRDEVEPREVERVTDYGMTYYVGAATPEHAEECDRIRTALLHRANQFKSDEHSPTVIKRFEVTSGGAHTFLVIELGLEGDEGTMASVFCRNFRHISIRGSERRKVFTLLNAKRKKDRNGYWNCLHALTR